ncbi:type II CRISPR RNA-guided endonuclease Cas9 [Pseudaminobacter arsenicus]|uniref:CRISPR-associated endonuclease Cas9 n=1 Tax=Borborobacter arsenicus TaxID=1851146 RepID=A0A432V8F0_9HYPH|nr:type II CRISPR RNA-guided endonuclease Cas9 [Pseudaminobacter arsenicus]
MTERAFAFDIGTNSLGGCVFKLDTDGRPIALEHMLVRIFSDGREPKSGNSLAEGRRVARGMARRRDRYKRRRKAVLRTLTEYGLMPADQQARKELLAETSDRSPREAVEQALADVYNLRARALSEKLPLHHIGRALFHLNQRRGFKSNRKADRKSNEKGAIEIGANRLHEKMQEAGARTLGQFLAMRRAKGEWVRVRSGALGEEGADDGRNSKTTYDFYPVRKLLEEEFNAIWEMQQPYYPEVLTEDRRSHLFRVMFYQRPLKAAIVGKCSFNPAETRLPKAHPLFQQFRLYKEVNELEIVLPDQSHRKLTLDERDTLVRQLKGIRKTTYKTLRKTLKLSGSEFRFNKETDNRVDMIGDEVNAALSDKKAFGNRWATFSTDEQWTVIDQLREQEDPLSLHEWLVVTYGVPDDAAEVVASIHLPDGYGRLGLTAISSMLEELKADVIPEAEAAKRAGYDHALAPTDGDLDRLPKYQEILERRIPPGTGEPDDPYDVAKGRITNPTVHIALNQMQQVVNGLIRQYGKPEQIAIELARDLKLNEKEKAEVNRKIGENTRAAAKRSEKLRELGQKDNGHNRNLLKLWEELNPDNPEDRVCIYTGRPIGIRMLFSGAVDVDHILPWSRTLDDSQANRILCVVEANRVKRDRAPAEVAEWASDYDAILERANRLPRNKRWRFARDAMEKYQDEEDFLARQLTDTQYLSRLAHEYLVALYPAEEADGDGVLKRRRHVRVIPGRLTEMLRRNWGLNSILPDHNFAGTAQAKNRKDHRHHAIDAAVVGVTTRSLLQKISTQAALRETIALEETVADIPEPWPTFRDDLKAMVERIVVSHKPDHGTLPKPGENGRTAGQLHNDTAYGITGECDARGNTIVVRRKPFLSLTDKDIPNIRDDELRRRLYSATSGLTGREFAAALDYFRKTDQKFHRIRHVRLTESLSVIPIRDKEGRAYKGYKGDANFRYDVWELPDGKWVADVVTMFDAHRPDRDPQAARPHPAARKVLSLKQNDMVAYEHPKDGLTIGRVVKFSTAGQIYLAGHNEAGALKARDADKDDPFKYFSKAASGLREIGARQLRVDGTGRVFDPGPQDRETRLERKARLGD